MQITTNIEIVCAKCGNPHAVELKPKFEPDANRYTYKTVPQCKCHFEDSHRARVNKIISTWPALKKDHIETVKD